MSQEHLFNRADIYDLIQDQTAKLKPRVERIPVSKILNATEQDLVEALVAEAWLHVPVLNEEGICIERAGEKQIDVSGDFRFMPYHRLGPAYVMGHETVIRVPFNGDADFFHVRPRRFGGIPPIAEIAEGALLLTYEGIDHSAEAVKSRYHTSVKEIKDYLAWLSEDANPYNDGLEARCRNQIAARKQKLLADANMVQAIGLPMRRREGVPLTYTVPVKRRIPKIEENPDRRHVQPGAGPRDV
jgi:hypothetical protein